MWSAPGSNMHETGLQVRRLALLISNISRFHGLPTPTPWPTVLATKMMFLDVKLSCDAENQAPAFWSEPGAAHHWIYGF